MAPPEISVSCPGCGFVLRLPVAAIRRDASYCSRCGVRVPLSNLPSQNTANSESDARARRRPIRSTKRR
jgi:uncharacterized paraquat-inducible protein A